MTKEKRKILYIVESMGGGVFTYLVELCNALIETYDIYIAHGIRKETPLNYKQCFDKRIRLIVIHNFCRGINPTKDIGALVEIRKVARQVSPDIIHLHSSKAGAIGRIAFNGKKTPLFYTPHGYSFLMSDCSRLKRFFYRSVEVLLAKRACMIIGCGEGEYQETLKFTRNADYINNAIDLDELQKLIGREANDSEHQFTVFTVGRICNQKNPKIFNQIAEAMPNIHFLWIGDGELRSELTSSNIKVTGWLKREDVVHEALHADVFILTSLWEGMPISILEAMYMKKVCIVSNVIGNRDIIHDGENGFVCDSVENFVEKIKMVQNEQLQSIVDHAYADVIQNYHTEVMASKYNALYQKKGIKVWSL